MQKPQPQPQTKSSLSGSWNVIGSILSTSISRASELAASYHRPSKQSAKYKRRRSSVGKDMHGVEELDDNGEILSETAMVAKSRLAKKQEQQKTALSLRSQRLLAVKEIVSDLAAEGIFERSQPQPSNASPSLILGAGAQIWNWVVPKLALPVFNSYSNNNNNTNSNSNNASNNSTVVSSPSPLTSLPATTSTIAAASSSSSGDLQSAEAFS